MPSSNVDCPCTDSVDNKLAAPVSNELTPTVKLLPTYKFLATPIPPLTTNAPVLVDVELVVSVNCADAVTNLTELIVLENNTVVPVDDNTTLPMYKELPLKYKSLNGLDAEPRLRPDVIGTNGPPKFV